MADMVDGIGVSADIVLGIPCRAEEIVAAEEERFDGALQACPNAPVNPGPELMLPPVAGRLEWWVAFKARVRRTSSVRPKCTR